MTIRGSDDVEVIEIHRPPQQQGQESIGSESAGASSKSSSCSSTSSPDEALASSQASWLLNLDEVNYGMVLSNPSDAEEVIRADASIKESPQEKTALEPPSSSQSYGGTVSTTLASLSRDSLGNANVMEALDRSIRAAESRPIPKFIFSASLWPRVGVTSSLGKESDPSKMGVGAASSPSKSAPQDDAKVAQMDETERWVKNLASVEHVLTKGKWSSIKTEAEKLREQIPANVEQYNRQLQQLTDRKQQSGQRVGQATETGLSPTCLSDTASLLEGALEWLPGDITMDTGSESLPLISGDKSRNLEMYTFEVDSFALQQGSAGMREGSPYTHMDDSLMRSEGHGGGSRSSLERYEASMSACDVYAAYEGGGGSSKNSSSMASWSEHPPSVPLAAAAPSSLSNEFAIYGPNDQSRWSGRAFPWTSEIYECNYHLGNREFRPLQREAINSLLSGNDTFVLIPTGGGKSRIYQVASLQKPGVTIVFSPLLALIQDQLHALNAWSIPATSLQGSNTAVVRQQAMDGNLKLIFLTPEKYAKNKATRQLLDDLYQQNKLAFFVIDEAHCVTQWGHDFRSDYLGLTNLKVSYPTIPIVALTATATNAVLRHTIATLRLRCTQVFRGSFNRENLFYEVVPKRHDLSRDIAEYINQHHPGECGIVYVFSRKEAENLAEDLQKRGIQSLAYHAQMSDTTREEVQRSWKEDRCQVIVATIAFGMGIDKPDVRFVLHSTMAYSPEGYYQESGRAGRDRENRADCRVYFSDQDRYKLARLKIDGSASLDSGMSRSESNKIKAQTLHKVLTQALMCHDYVTCRRVSMLSYFDEVFDARQCNKMCDNCLNGDRAMLVDATPFAIAVINLLEAATSRGMSTTGMTAITGACVLASNPQKRDAELITARSVIYRTDLRDLFLGRKDATPNTTKRKMQRQQVEEAVANVEDLGYARNHPLVSGDSGTLPTISFSKDHFDALLARMASLGLVCEYTKQINDSPVACVGLGTPQQIAKLKRDWESCPRSMSVSMTQRAREDPDRPLLPHYEHLLGYDSTTGLLPDGKFRVVISVRVSKDDATSKRSLRVRRVGHTSSESRTNSERTPSAGVGLANAQQKTQGNQRATSSTLFDIPHHTLLDSEVTSSLALLAPEEVIEPSEPKIGGKRRHRQSQASTYELGGLPLEHKSGSSGVSLPTVRDLPVVMDSASAQDGHEKKAQAPPVVVPIAGTTIGPSVVRTTSLQPPPTLLGPMSSTALPTRTTSQDVKEVDLGKTMKRSTSQSSIASFIIASHQRALPATASTTATSLVKSESSRVSSDATGRSTSSPMSSTVGPLPSLAPSFVTLEPTSAAAVPQFMPGMSQLGQEPLQDGEAGPLSPEARDELETLLFEVRKTIVREKLGGNVHVHQVFENKVITRIVKAVPTTMLDLVDIEGFGLNRAEKFGAYVLCCVGDVLRTYPTPGLTAPPPYLTLSRVEEAERALLPQLQKLKRLVRDAGADGAANLSQERASTQENSQAMSPVATLHSRIGSSWLGQK